MHETQRFHRLADARRQQGVTLKNIARRMGVSMEEAARQEGAGGELRLSELHAWQSVLELPVSELLFEVDSQLSAPVFERARMLRLIKTVLDVRSRNRDQRLESTLQMLVDQILEIMPDMKILLDGERR
jgi:transcriptional regulator with XRE-family HTH domain